MLAGLPSLRWSSEAKRRQIVVNTRVEGRRRDRAFQVPSESQCAPVIAGGRSGPVELRNLIVVGCFGMLKELEVSCAKVLSLGGGLGSFFDGLDAASFEYRWQGSGQGATLEVRVLLWPDKTVSFPCHCGAAWDLHTAMNGLDPHLRSRQSAVACSAPHVSRILFVFFVFTFQFKMLEQMNEVLFSEISMFILFLPICESANVFISREESWWDLRYEFHGSCPLRNSKMSTTQLNSEYDDDEIVSHRDGTNSLDLPWQDENKNIVSLTNWRFSNIWRHHKRNTLRIKKKSGVVKSLISGQENFSDIEDTFSVNEIDKSRNKIEQTGFSSFSWLSSICESMCAVEFLCWCRGRDRVGVMRKNFCRINYSWYVLVIGMWSSVVMLHPCISDWR